MRQMFFLTMLHGKVRAGGQFIIATHSPIIMAYPDAWIYRFGGSEIQQIAYKDTEHFRITRDFLNKPEQMLKILLANEPTLFDSRND
jgi:predicted ATPase